MHPLNYFHFIHFLNHSWPFLTQCVDPTNGKHVLVFSFLFSLSKNQSSASLIKQQRQHRPKFISVPCWSESSSGSNKSSEYNRLEHDEKLLFGLCCNYWCCIAQNEGKRKERSTQPILYMSDGEITCSTYVYRKRHKGEGKEYCGFSKWHLSSYRYNINVEIFLDQKIMHLDK